VSDAPSPPETWDAFFSDFYLRVAAGDERHEREARAQALGAARLAQCPDGGDLLDVACGFGRHAVALAQAGLPRAAVAAELRPDGGPFATDTRLVAVARR
jgi:hypothetical protein